MRIGLQNTDWEYVAAKLAHEGDDAQAMFFKAFIKECLSWGTRYQVDLQLAGVNQKLSEAEIDVIGMLGYKDEDAPP